MSDADSVIPAQAGNQNSQDNWFPACAGMTELAIENLRLASSSTHSDFNQAVSNAV